MSEDGGGVGNDTFITQGNFDTFNTTYNLDGSVSLNSDVGTDKLINIEFVEFDDGIKTISDVIGPVAPTSITLDNLSVDENSPGAHIATISGDDPNNDTLDNTSIISVSIVDKSTGLIVPNSTLTRVDSGSSSQFRHWPPCSHNATQRFRRYLPLGEESRCTNTCVSPKNELRPWSTCKSCLLSCVLSALTGK